MSKHDNQTDDIDAHELFIACDMGDIRLIERRIAEGVSLDVRDTQNHETLLHRAASLRDPEMVKRLLDAGLDPNATDRFGANPLKDVGMQVMEMSPSESDGIVQMLVDAGADVNQADDGGNTPLMTAVANLIPDDVAYLIDKGAQVNAANNAGVYALFDVACTSHKMGIAPMLEIVELLIGAGADPYQPTHYGNGEHFMDYLAQRPVEPYKTIAQGVKAAMANVERKKLLKRKSSAAASETGLGV